MADCSAAGTTIDRAARAVLGGANSASSSTAGKHVGALLGHTAMSMSMSAGAVPSMPLMSPNRLVLHSAQQQAQQQQAQQQQAQQPMVSSQQQNQYNPMMMHHPGSAVAPRNLLVQQFHQQQQQQQQLHQQQHMQHHQHQIQMQLQMQQQQQAITMMLQQQQQQQNQQQQQQQQLEQSKVDAGNIDQQGQNEQQQQNNDWHDGLEEEYLREQDALGDDAFDDLEDIRAITGGAGIEELAAAWADAEAEYDNVLSDYDDQRQQQEQGQADGNVLVDEDNYANLWQGDNTMSLDTPKAYKFVNPLENRPVEDTSTTALNNKNYMEEGMKHFQEGNIREAIESFEMELQVQNTDNAVAWRMLGKCHAENDQDPEAIQCLEAAVDRDPFCPEALLALGVSYVNELNHEKALENMKAWFTHNPKYAGMELPANSSFQNNYSGDDIYGAAANATTTTTTTTTDGENENENNDDDNITDSHRTAKESAFDEVKSMLLAALAFDPTSSTDTANNGDVYEALGVIYNVIKDYDSAIDAFRKALERRPNDHQLWNKLGATLANGSQSEQALPTYHQSLQLKPKYARAWLNMAISHSNLQDHDEAARCYLQTLSLNPGATHCWTYLRMSLSSKERWDLLPLVFERNLSGFQEHFDFVLY